MAAMRTFIRDRSLSATTVVFVLLITMLLEGSISFTLMFGKLTDQAPLPTMNHLQVAWFAVRIALMTAVLVLWALNRKSSLFRALIVTNGVLTLGLLASTGGAAGLALRRIIQVGRRPVARRGAHGRGERPGLLDLVLGHRPAGHR
jgi:hypothetical protein